LGISDSSFIPAKESKWFIFIFDFYVRSLFRRRFKNIWIAQEYRPTESGKTIYYLNHTSWWDGLIPLLLNQKRFKQKARAMMEDKQMRQHTFFSKIGAFSVNLENPRSAVKSLRYAVDSLNRPNSCLFIYPEGKIVPFTINRPSFKKGLGWISNQCPHIDVVPVGIYIHTANHDKPELFIKVGKPVKADHSLDSETLNEIFEIKMGELLISLQNNAHNKLHFFNPI
jgi:chlorobactene lauroyltransferase